MDNKTKTQVLEIIRNLINFPFPQICVHLISLDLLQLLIDNDADIPDDLIKSVSLSSNGDEESIAILNKLIQEGKNVEEISFEDFPEPDTIVESVAYSKKHKTLNTLISAR